MGDISAEPSMEDILSSIKRIIAEEGEPAPARPRRQPRGPAPAAARQDDEGDAEAHEVLELNDPMPQPLPSPPPLRREAPTAVEPQVAYPAAPPPAEPAGEPIVSQHTAAATRGSLDALSRMMVKPEPSSDGTLEGLVREMLRPILREWVDAHLPGMVEAMVAKEIARITGQAS